LENLDKLHDFANNHGNVDSRLEHMFYKLCY